MVTDPPGAQWVRFYVRAERAGRSVSAQSSAMGHEGAVPWCCTIVRRVFSEHCCHRDVPTHAFLLQARKLESDGASHGAHRGDTAAARLRCIPSRGSQRRVALEQEWLAPHRELPDDDDASERPGRRRGRAAAVAGGEAARGGRGDGGRGPRAALRRADRGGEAAREGARGDDGLDVRVGGREQQGRVGGRRRRRLGAGLGEHPGRRRGRRRRALQAAQAQRRKRRGQACGACFCAWRLLLVVGCGSAILTSCALSCRHHHH